MNNMTEAPLSANFNMYLGKRKIQFTYRDIHREEDYIAELTSYMRRLEQAGFTDEPAEPTEGGEEHTITAYVVGLANDAKTGGKQPCIFCYTDYFDMCAFVLYSNHLALLPFAIEKAQPWQGWRPPKADAEGAGWLIACEPFTVRQEIMTDWKTGEPLLYTEGPGKGKPKKKISHINGKPVEDAAVTPVTTTIAAAPVNGNGHKPAPQPPADDPFNDKSAGPLMSDSQKVTMHALGTALYGKQWDSKRAAFAKAMNVASSNDFTVSQATTINDGMNKKLSDAMYALAAERSLSLDEAERITASVRGGKEFSKLEGVALTKAFRIIEAYAPELPETLGESELAF